jgi:hypothetical protein
VTTYLANTLTPATLYADDDVSTMANPVQANALGQVAYRVNPGLYDISMSWDGAQPTVVEDVLAWTPEAAVLQQPGDLLVQGQTGTPQRLQVGPERAILTMDGGMPTWRYLQGETSLPPGPDGSLLYYGAAGYVHPIPPGTQDQALAMAGGVPTWVSSLIPPGTTLPINQPGDLVIGAPSTGLPSRLAVGPLGSTLTVSENATLVWGEPGSVGPGVGQCYLSVENTNSLWLTPYQGNKIWVNGKAQTIPDAGLRIAPTGLSLHTNYYIYVFWNGTALQLEPSTTGWQQTNGVMHKQGDASRTLVGYARVLEESYAGGAPLVPAWVDSEKYRCVLSFFNQDERTGTGFFRAPHSMGSNPDVPIEVHDEIRCYFITWGFTNVSLTLTGAVYSTASFPIAIISYLALDQVEQVGIATSALQAGPRLNIACGITKTLAAQDMLHMITLHGLTQSGGSATWDGEASGITSCRMTFTIST